MSIKSKKIRDEKKAIKTLKTWRTEAKTDANYETKAAKRHRRSGNNAQARVDEQEAKRANMFVGIRTDDIKKEKSKLDKIIKKIRGKR